MLHRLAHAGKTGDATDVIDLAPGVGKTLGGKQATSTHGSPCGDRGPPVAAGVGHQQATTREETNDDASALP
eukprot:11195218-Lingulodinium_polyedra.AAC.1